jgi:hypothetical protein
MIEVDVLPGLLAEFRRGPELLILESPGSIAVVIVLTKPEFASHANEA